MDRQRMAPDEVHALIAGALERSDVSAANAASVATALLAAELWGQSGHGLRRVEAYAAQARAGKVHGHATPSGGSDPRGRAGDRRRARLRLPRPRSGRGPPARDGAGERHRHGGHPPLAPLRRGGRAGGAAGAVRHGRADVRQRARRHRAVGRAHRAVRHRSHRLRRARPWRRAHRGRRVALQGRARQADGGQGSAASRSPRAGRSRPTARPPPIPPPAWPARWCRWATPRARRWQ